MMFILVGTTCGVFAMKGFMIPNHLMDGGVTGVSILIHEIYHINISLLILGLNAYFIFLSKKYIGSTFAIQTSIAIVLLSLGLEFLPVPTITNDKILIAIFGGFFIGIGMGFVVRAGGVIDGAEVIAVFTTKRIGISMSEIILIFNTLIFLTVAYKLGIESAMYSIITYFTATKMCDYVADGIEEYIALYIISSQCEPIKSMIVNDFNKGIVVYKGERGYLPGSFEVKQDVDVIVTIMTRLEILKIKDSIYEIDDKAFMYITSVKEAKGGVLKKKNVH
ncbi:MAG: YitT family protein [Chitinophagales bacterium]|nr:YitT family protein [Sphingobacteriales bacterium]